MALQRKKPVAKRTPAKRTTSKQSAGKSRSRQESGSEKGYFNVALTFGGDKRTYQYPSEEGAVLFACRNTRPNGNAVVYDPDGNVIVRFKPREYDTRAYERPAAPFINEAIGELQADVAKARAERMGRASGAQTKKKAAGGGSTTKAAAAKKGSEGKRTLKRRG